MNMSGTSQKCNQKVCSELTSKSMKYKAERAFFFSNLLYLFTWAICSVFVARSILWQETETYIYIWNNFCGWIQMSKCLLYLWHFIWPAGRKFGHPWYRLCSHYSDFNFFVLLCSHSTATVGIYLLKPPGASSVNDWRSLVSESVRYRLSYILSCSAVKLPFYQSLQEWEVSQSVLKEVPRS